MFSEIIIIIIFIIIARHSSNKIIINTKIMKLHRSEPPISRLHNCGLETVYFC